MGISKSTIIQNIWENFYNRLSSDVTSVTITGSVNVTVKTYTNSFPDKSLDTKSDFPILVINSPSISWENFTFGKKYCTGSISIDIYTTQGESADKFLDKIINSIETYRDTLKGDNLFDVNLDSTDKDRVNRGAFNVHLATCTFSFRYIFNQTNVGS